MRVFLDLSIWNAYENVHLPVSEMVHACVNVHVNEHAHVNPNGKVYDNANVYVNVYNL